MLALRDITLSYGGAPVVKGVNVDIYEGELVSIIGPNGAGKSTLIKAICGFLPVRSGKIIFGGEDITGLAPHERAKRGIAIVPEGRRVFPALTVEKNLLMGAYLCIDRYELKGNLDKVFALFPQLAERRSQKGGTLSGGEQQMLAIGRALMGSPRLLVMDEPSTGLAPYLLTSIFATIAELHSRGITILLVEQNAKKALKLSDRAYILNRGEIVLSGKGEELLGDEEVHRAYLGK